MQKTALVTGSSKGIGKAIALRLARDGYFVYVTYCTDQTGGESTVEDIIRDGGNASLHALDVSREQSVKNFMETIGNLDLLVNNAERDVSKPMAESTFEEWKMAFDTKLHGAWLCTKYAIPLLRKSANPNIIMISTSADERPDPEILSYAVATGALNTMIKALAVHLAPDKIRVNTVMPGQTRTDNWGDAKNDDALWQSFADSNPLKRNTTANEVADAVLLLVNDPHKFLNGNFLYVNGGSHLK